jgi:hypothetical protein
MDKIRSGQSFLYRENGLNSTVFDIRMKNSIRGDYLQRALSTTLQRFPYMASKLVEKDGNFYLEECLNSMNVVKTKKLRRLGSMSTGYHLVDVTYFDNKICIAFHHALCDGRGIKPFLETLVYYYCCLRYNRKFDSSGIRLAGEPLFPGETQDPIGDSLFEVDKSKLPQIAKDGYALPENAQACEDYYRYEINMNRQSFLEYMKDHEATPAILLAMLMSDSIYSVHPDADKPIVCSMAVDYRREIGLDNTHKNCVGSLYLPYSEETNRMRVSEQAQLYRDLIKQQRQPDAIKSLINVQIGLCKKLDQIPSLEAKRQALSFFNDLRVDTYVISYLGQMHLGGCEEYVESVHLYNSGVKGLRINMVCAGDYFTVDFLQSFESESLINALRKTLDGVGIEYTASERIQFETMKDRAFITASSQAERYYKVP